jgi:endonuclease YncB( thermonuclease family)
MTAAATSTRRCLMSAAAIFTVMISVARAQDTAGTFAAACRLETIGQGTVRAVLDSRTLSLADGREVRLAAIEMPPSAAAALVRLLVGREVTLKRLRPETDRYGRTLVFPVAAGAQRPAQHVLLAEGQARVAARVGDMPCAAELLRAESAARAAGLGLWADATAAARRADAPAEVLARRGRFTLVEGDVLSVREFHGVIYVNFGRRWSEDFTATVVKRNERVFAAAGMDVKKLAGHSVRVRGVVEERGGPWIEATRPEQIEIIGVRTPSAPVAGRASAE